MTKHTALVVTAIVLSAAAAYAAQTGTFRIHAHGVEPATVSQLRADLAWAEDRVERWLGEFPTR